MAAPPTLDVRRDYFRLRPRLGRLHLGVRDPRPFLDALRTLGFRPFDEPIEVGGAPFHLAGLDFGPDSVDGWLNRIAAAELGESEQPFLDERDRSVDLGDVRIQLSPLEFGGLNTLAAHRCGAGVARRPAPRGIGHELRRWQQHRRRS